MRPRAVVALLLFSTGMFGQDSGTADDIVAWLMKDAYPPQVRQLNYAAKATAVKQLRAAQEKATGKRSQKVAFLLAALDSEYEQNRDSLIKTLEGCRHPDTETGCDEDTAGLVIGLYAQGHHEVLEALMASGVKGDGALAEALGPFYGDVLAGSAAEFVGELQKLDAAGRKAVCGLAGGGDGGGTLVLESVRRELKGVGGEVALRCLKDVEAGKRESEGGDKQ